MIEILQETKTSVVCVKPVGIAAQGMDAQALPQLLAAQLGCEVYPVHRLDQAVGGVMVFARSRMADSLLSRQVQAHTFQKDYLAVLEGVPAQASGVLEDQLRQGCVGQRLAALLLERGAAPEKLRLLNAGERLPAQGSVRQLYHALGLDAQGVVCAVKEVLA